MGPLICCEDLAGAFLECTDSATNRLCVHFGVSGKDLCLGEFVFRVVEMGVGFFGFHGGGVWGGGGGGWLPASDSRVLVFSALEKAVGRLIRVRRADHITPASPDKGTCVYSKVQVTFTTDPPPPNKSFNDKL